MKNRPHLVLAPVASIPEPTSDQDRLDGPTMRYEVWRFTPLGPHQVEGVDFIDDTAAGLYAAQANASEAEAARINQRPVRSVFRVVEVIETRRDLG